MIEGMPLWAIAPAFAEQARVPVVRNGTKFTQQHETFGVVPIVGAVDKETLVDVRRQIYALTEDDAVAEIMLYIDSPGGTAAGTADAATAVSRAAANKPVVAFIEDLGASAAYWIASQARRVVCNRTALVGSIGAFVVLADTSRFWEKLGVDWFVVRSGSYKGATVEGAKVTGEVLEHLQERVDALARIFVGDVARGRRMKPDRVRELADGRVWTGVAAKAAGLVDAIGTWEDVLGDVAERSRINSLRGQEAVRQFEQFIAREFSHCPAGSRERVAAQYPGLAAAAAAEAGPKNVDGTPPRKYVGRGAGLKYDF